MECQSHARSSPVAHSIPTLFDDAISICRAAEVRSSWGRSQAMRPIEKALMTAREDFQREPMIDHARGCIQRRQVYVDQQSSGPQSLCNWYRAHYLRPRVSSWEGNLLVDSAGLDAMNQPTHKEKALEAARRSNMAVVMLNARQPLRDSEGPILRELVEAKSRWWWPSTIGTMLKPRRSVSSAARTLNKSQGVDACKASSPNHTHQCQEVGR